MTRPVRAIAPPPAPSLRADYTADARIAIKDKDIGSEYASAFRITEKNDRTVRPRYE